MDNRWSVESRLIAALSGGVLEVQDAGVQGNALGMHSQHIPIPNNGRPNKINWIDLSPSPLFSMSQTFNVRPQSRREPKRIRFDNTIACYYIQLANQSDGMQFHLILSIIYSLVNFAATTTANDANNDASAPEALLLSKKDASTSSTTSTVNTPTLLADTDSTLNSVHRDDRRTFKKSEFQPRVTRVDRGVARRAIGSISRNWSAWCGGKPTYW